MNKSEPSAASKHESASSTPRDEKGSTTPKTPTKPILKRERSEKNNRRSLVWDEENLHLNEIQRTPKMKIDEPKTPYHHDNGLEGDEDTGDGEREVRSPPERVNNFLEHWEEFHNAMEKVHHKQQKTSVGGDSRGSPSPSALSSARRRSTGSHSDGEGDRASGGETSGSESDGDRKHFKKDEFIKRRKAHYNEFLVFKTLREHDESEEGEDQQQQQQHAASASSPPNPQHSHPQVQSSSQQTPAPASSSSAPAPHNNGHPPQVKQSRQASSPLQQRSTSSPALTSKIKKDPPSAAAESSSTSSPPGRRSGKGIGFALPPGSSKNT